MNLNSLTRDEAAMLIFAIKKTLRDREGLTPEMEQFYDNTFDTLREKVERIDSAIKDGRSLLDEARIRKAAVSNPWPSN
jgi:hypothetical protein